MNNNYPDIYNIFDTQYKEGFKGFRGFDRAIKKVKNKEKACRDRGYTSCADEQSKLLSKATKPLIEKPIIAPPPRRIPTQIPTKTRSPPFLPPRRIPRRIPTTIPTNQAVVTQETFKDSSLRTEELKLDAELENEKRKLDAENEIKEWKTAIKFASEAEMKRREEGIKSKQDAVNATIMEQIQKTREEAQKRHEEELKRQKSEVSKWNIFFQNSTKEADDKLKEQESEYNNRKTEHQKSLSDMTTKYNIKQEQRFNKQESKFNNQQLEHQKSLSDMTNKYNTEKENWDSYKTAFCPGQGTYSLDDLNQNKNFDTFDTNRYTNIETETKSTYDLLKRSEICTTINNDELIEKYKTKVDNEQDILKREHSELLRYYETFMNDMQDMLNDETEQNTNTNITGKNKNNDNINKRKSYYQSVQSQERKWYIRLIEIIYLVIWIIMAVSVFLKPDLSIFKKVAIIMLFVILPYFTFNYLIHWIQFIRNYILTTFNVYDNVYNHVK